jgi:hypothetical protein
MQKWHLKKKWAAILGQHRQIAYLAPLSYNISRMQSRLDIFYTPFPISIWPSQVSLLDHLKMALGSRAYCTMVVKKNIRITKLYHWYLSASKIDRQFWSNVKLAAHAAAAPSGVWEDTFFSCMKVSDFHVNISRNTTTFYKQPSMAIL